MSPIAQAALNLARQPALALAYSTQTAIRPKPIPELVVRGPINHY